jgi:NAD(P)-dependent dehydrogenase (short-subunit alcohol dehydrogenase family)
VRRLEGKTAIVTGAARGIGRAIAEAMANEGACVVLADRDSEEAKRVAAAIGGGDGQALALPVDVALRDDVEAMVATTAETFGPPEVLVTCAGILAVRELQGLLELTDDEWNGVLDVNLRGTFLCAQAVARLLVAHGRPGSIATVSSVGATRPSDGAPAYHASKGGVEGLTRSLAVNLGPHGIRVNAIAPGYIATDMTRDGLDDIGTWTAIHSRIPLGYMGDAAALAGAAVYLASDESAYVTGQTLAVDGGALVLGWSPATIRANPPLAGGGA